MASWWNKTGYRHSFDRSLEAISSRLAAAIQLPLSAPGYHLPSIGKMKGFQLYVRKYIIRNVANRVH